MDRRIFNLVAITLFMVMGMLPYTRSVCFGGDEPLINEYYVYHVGGNEWVELYNPGLSNKGITGWQLLTIAGDKLSSKRLSGELPSGGYLAVRTSTLSEFDHGSIALIDNLGRQQDWVDYGYNNELVSEGPSNSVGNCYGSFTVMPATKGMANICDYATVSGSVFRDSDGDGAKGSTEPGLLGVKVTLSSVDSFTSTSTGVSGEGDSWYSGTYSFKVYNPGIYTITEKDPKSYLSTNAIPGAGVTKIDNNRLQVEITEQDILDGEEFDENFFGDILSQAPGHQDPDINVIQVYGQVWEDTNANGQKDADETGLGGVVVGLNTGLWQTTTSDGWFALYASPLKEIKLFRLNNPDGYSSTNAIPGTAAKYMDKDTIIIDGTKVPYFEEPSPYLSGYISEEHYFGAVLKSSWTIIAGTVFDDQNCNGTFEEGEVGLSDVTLEVDDQGETFSVQTDEYGWYMFPIAPDTLVFITSLGLGGDYFPTTLWNHVPAISTPKVVYRMNFGYANLCP